MTCVQCGVSIPAPRRGQRFCTGRCRYAWHRSKRPPPASWKTVMQDELAEVKQQVKDLSFKLDCFINDLKIAST